ncbi:MAG TPA: PEGA domain-containing protein [Kofleriaceae bacterium]|nr:PEGA domain-containing protein [Kofleriaceae bacterium]
MRGWVAGLLCVAAVGGVASASPTRKVQVETEPPNATVYIGDEDSGPKCTKTPCTIDAPVGKPTIIIRLDKYDPIVEALDVPRGTRPLTAKYKLKSAVGTIVVLQPKGASVEIDGEDQGTVGSSPLRADVSAESHMVTVTLKGKTYFDDAIDVGTGAEEEIGPDREGWKSNGTPVATGGGGGGGGAGEGEGEGEGDGGGSGEGAGAGSGSDTGIDGSATPAPTTPFFQVASATDIGFRRFSYDMPQSNNLKPESEDGQVITGIIAELFPFRAKKNASKGFSLLARAQFGVHGQQLTGGMIMGTVTTFWASYEGSARYRYNIGTGFAIEGSGGYVRDQMQFNASNGNDIKLVPDATYQSVRLGLRLVLVSGPLEAYFSGENRIVMNGGNIATRFDTASATGLRGALGAIYAKGKFFARVEGAILRYSWTFTYDGVNDIEQADGATDSVRLISLQAGLRFGAN